jgi:hypothetical protein
LQLKAYVQGQSIFPPIDNTYSAKAVNNAVLDQILQEKGRQITEIIISLQCLLIVFILAAVIVVIAVHGCSESGKWCKTLQKFPTTNVHFRTKQASILAVVTVSYVIISYIIALDIAALVRRDRPFNQLIFDIHNKRQSELDHPFRLLYEIPGIVFAFDLLGALISLGMTIVSIISHVCPYAQCFTFILQQCTCCYCQECLISISNNPFVVLCLSTLGLICCIVTHIPFVAIAYLNDAFHAGSIFVYYTIICLVLFAVVEKLIVSCQNKFSFDQETISLEDTRWSLKEGSLYVFEQDKTSLIPLRLHVGIRKHGDGNAHDGDGNAHDGDGNNNNSDGKEVINSLRLSSGQIKFDFKKVDNKIILGIEDGELNFVNSSTASEYLTTLKNQQEPKVITLGEKILPTVCMEPLKERNEHEASVQHHENTKSFTFSGLRPIQGQNLNVCKIHDIPENRKQPIKVELGKTILTLRREGQLQNRTCLGCSCGWITTLLILLQ